MAGAAGELDVVVVGAGVAGLCALHRLREQGLAVAAFETGADIGGTLLRDVHPGPYRYADYSSPFDSDARQGWEWTEECASRPEIFSYLRHVADRHDLRRDVVLRTRVTHAAFDEIADRWVVRTDQGHVLRARYCVMATGCLTGPTSPELDRDPWHHAGATALLGIDIRGRCDLPLRRKWEAGPVSYLGLAISGFPNLFTITGPGSPAERGAAVGSIAQHVDWVGELLGHMTAGDRHLVEAVDTAEKEWTDHVHTRVRTPCAGEAGRYRQTCDEVARNGYEGFELH